MIVCVNKTELEAGKILFPIFGQIMGMNLLNENSEFLFTLRLFETQHFDERYGGFVVKPMPQVLQLNQCQLFHQYPLYLWSPKKNGGDQIKIVALKAELV